MVAKFTIMMINIYVIYIQDHMQTVINRLIIIFTPQILLFISKMKLQQKSSGELFYSPTKQSIIANKWTNDLLIQRNKYQTTYYVPAYMRIKCKNMVDMDFQNLAGKMNSTIIFTVYYGSLSEQIVQYLKSHTELSFNKGDALLLTDDGVSMNLKEQPKKCYYTYTIRKILNSHLQCDVFWSPFQTIRLIMTIGVRTIKFKTSKNQKICVKFNLMDCQDSDVKFSTTEQRQYGQYKIADKMLKVQYSNQYAYSQSTAAKKNDQKKRIVSLFSKTDSFKVLPEEQNQLQPLRSSQKLRNYEYAHFILPLYKVPMATVLTIYIPTLLLAIINWAIYFQNDAAAKRVQNVAALMVSFVALIPTIRQQLPLNPNVTFLQIAVFLQSFTTILTLFATISIKDYSTFQEDWKTDGLLISSVLITAFVFVMIVALSVLHEFKWKHDYKRSTPAKDAKFVRQEWYNSDCDKYFDHANKQEANVTIYQTPLQQVKSLKSNKIFLAPLEL